MLYEYNGLEFLVVVFTWAAKGKMPRIPKGKMPNFGRPINGTWGRAFLYLGCERENAEDSERENA